MRDSRQDLDRIRDLLATHPSGLSIQELSEILGLNRNSVGKYLEVLQKQGLVDKRQVSAAKVFTLSRRLPASALAHLSTVPMAAVDHLLRVVHATPSLLELIHMRPEELIGRPIADAPTLPFQDAEWTAMLTRTIRGEALAGACWLGTGAARAEWAVQLIPTVLEDGRPGATLLMTALDQGKDRDAVFTEERARILAAEGTELVVRTRADLSIMETNPAFCRLIGLPCGSVVGRRFRLLLVREDRQAWDVALGALDPSHPDSELECRVIGSDGQVHRYRWRHHALFGSGSRIQEIVSVGTETTELRRLEDRLNEAHAHLDTVVAQRVEELQEINRQLYTEIALREQAERRLRLSSLSMDHAADLICWVTTDGRIFYANRALCDTIEYEATELEAMTITGIAPGFSEPLIERVLIEVQQQGSALIRVDFRRRDGTEVPVELSINYLMEHGEECFCCIGRDLSMIGRAVELVCQDEG